VGIVVWGVVDQSYDRIHKDEAQFYERKGLNVQILQFMLIVLGGMCVGGSPT